MNERGGGIQWGTGSVGIEDEGKEGLDRLKLIISTEFICHCTCLMLQKKTRNDSHNATAFRIVLGLKLFAYC